MSFMEGKINVYTYREYMVYFGGIRAIFLDPSNLPATRDRAD